MLQHSNDFIISDFIKRTCCCSPCSSLGSSDCFCNWLPKAFPQLHSLPFSALPLVLPKFSFEALPPLLL